MWGSQQAPTDCCVAACCSTVGQHRHEGSKHRARPVTAAQITIIWRRRGSEREPRLNGEEWRVNWSDVPLLAWTCPRSLWPTSGESLHTSEPTPSAGITSRGKEFQSHAPKNSPTRMKIMPLRSFFIMSLCLFSDDGGHTWRKWSLKLHF